MNNSVAIILAGVIVGGSIIYAHYLDTFGVSATQGANDTPVAWRLNKRTVILSACYPKNMPDGKYQTQCD